MRSLLVRSNRFAAQRTFVRFASTASPEAPAAPINEAPKVEKVEPEKKATIIKKNWKSRVAKNYKNLTINGYLIAGCLPLAFMSESPALFESVLMVTIPIQINHELKGVLNDYAPEWCGPYTQKGIALSLAFFAFLGLAGLSYGADMKVALESGVDLKKVYEEGEEGKLEKLRSVGGRGFTGVIKQIWREQAAPVVSPHQKD